MNTSDILTIVTAIVGILVSYYFFRKAQREKEPCWAIKSNNLIRNFSSRISKLEVFYDQEKVENLTISRIVFWNNGAETIEKHHIVAEAPLKISGKSGIKILDAEILMQNNLYSNFSAKKSNDQLHACIEFEYLDKDNGAVVQIIHTGVSSQDIRIEGTIKGVNRIHKKMIKTVWLPLNMPKKFNRRFSPLVRRKISIFINFLGAILALMVCGHAVLNFATKESKYITVLAGSYFFVFCLFFIGQAIELWATASPRGLEIFEDELTV